MALQIYLASIVLGLTSYVYCENYRAIRPVCDFGSCHPKTGNLLIGRASNLTATSTCGLKGPVSYCIVSHLEKGKSLGKKCFTCDSRPGVHINISHRIENVIYNNAPGSDLLTWWQSENGKEDVSIRLDLEAEFHFTHLIMKFRTFKPAAMLVERSSDYGNTWKVYRYFAEKCDTAFPYVNRGRQKSLLDVVCDSNYWKDNPTTEGGEVILRVISPSLQGKRDPYTEEVQQLLKITNLRINFTKLFTLGDDLLDKRHQIQEKYYYAITEMTVRGSCWCYGHAEKCLPQDEYTPQIPDMVYGKCDCSHNTTGFNCDKCKPTHNDLEWRAATGRSTNACKKCNCNDHAETCDFDRDVFLKSGQVSGSVCHNCQHNTMGNNCEKCIPGFYHDPSLPITHPYTCLSCDCDLRGATDQGLCDSYDFDSEKNPGQCHCKENVMGLKCNRCKPGFWNLDENNPLGCEACNCSPAGSRTDSTCDEITGECFCKNNVVGNNCDQCDYEHWGLSADTNGCEPCNCDIGGSVNVNCDVITGQCKCLPHITGKTCNKPEQGYYFENLDTVLEAENAKCAPNCQHIEKLYPKDYYTGSGHMKVFNKSEIEFFVNNIPFSGEYDIILRYEQPEYDWADVTLELIPDAFNPNGPCANARPDYVKKLQPRSDSKYVVANSSLCLEKGQNYKLKLTFKSDSNQVDPPSASILIDSVAFVPKTETIPFFHGSPMSELRKSDYERYQCNEAYFTPLHRNIPDICKKYHFSISVFMHGGAHECKCDPTGSKSALCKEDGGECDCKQNVVGRMCDRCSSGTYGFYSPEGCKDCDCNWAGAIDNHCDVETGQCTCKTGISGRQCDRCHPGSWDFPNCKPCICHGHAHTCDSDSGACYGCQNFTTGHYCDRCEDGYYGEPTDSTLYGGTPCRPCRCPDTIDSGHSFAKSCSLNPVTKDVLCMCEEGYHGPNCDRCAENYFGNPEEPGGSCNSCDCNDNVDISVPGNCHSRTGECLQCLYNTSGRHCEYCQDKFYGDALSKQCTECLCNLLGTDSKGGPCDRVTGQCPCLPNVEGMHCDRCKEDHWAIARGTGCIPCDCDPIGSLDTHCNEFTGACNCKAGFGGDKCNECQAMYWGSPLVECNPCDCNRDGAVNGHCRQEDGVCFCKEGIGGVKCDVCARGYNGTAPYCYKCGECFDNWDLIISGLSNKTNDVIEEARNVKRKGTPGAYNSAFDDMTKRLDDVSQSLTNTKMNKIELDVLNSRVNNFRNTALNRSTEKVNKLSNVVQNVLSNISIASLSLTTVNDKAQALQSAAMALSDNATHLQEKDLKGALNLTREAGENSKKVHLIEKNTTSLLNEADRQCRRTENFLNKDNDSFTKAELKNEEAKLNLEFEISLLEKKIPDLNDKICDKKGDPCHQLCGGAGCGRCGGFSCDAGAVGKADAGMNLITEIKEKIDNQLRKYEMLYRQISSAKIATAAGKDSVEKAHDAASEVKNQYEDIVLMLSEVNKRFETFIQTPGATPAEIRQIANEALDLNIQLKPQQIKDLADRINETVASLTNINSILEDTKQNQTIANNLKSKSDEAKVQAEKILEKAQKVVEALKAAKEAQEEAEKAINTAHEDITATKKDLKQIESETNEATSKARNATDRLKEVNTKLKQLQSLVLNHANGAKQVSSEAERVSKKVEDSKNKVLDLNLQYNSVNTSVQRRSENSSTSKLRAQKLLEKARQLSVNTTAKFKELKDADNMYNEQDLKLMEVSKNIDMLTKSVGLYIENIASKATIYKICS